MSDKLVRMVSTARHQYGGRLLRPGDIFEATEADARYLEAPAINFARRLVDEEAPNRYRRRDLRAER